VKDEQGERDYLSLSVRDFISATAGRQPTPGGGSAAGIIGALGAALGEMALNYTRGKKEFAEHEEFYSRVGRHLNRARTMFDALTNDDAEAYQLYREASKIPKGPEREESLQLALAAAIDVPREMAKLALAALTDLQALAQKCNPLLISDVKAGAVLSAAVVTICHYNVQINVPQFADRDAAQEILAASLSDLTNARQILRNFEDE